MDLQNTIQRNTEQVMKEYWNLLLKGRYKKAYLIAISNPDLNFPCLDILAKYLFR